MSTRYRSQGKFTPASVPEYYRRQTTCQETGWVLNGTGSAVHIGVQKTMTDNITPNYRRRIREGEVIFNDMASEVRSSNEGSGSGSLIESIGPSCTNPWFKGEWKIDSNVFPAIISAGGPLPVEAAIPETDMADLRREVSTRCLANRGEPNGNLFESLAEYKQTLRMLRRPLNSFGVFFHKNTPKILKLDPSAAWLAYRYGLRPLISDVTGIIKGLERSIGLERQTTRSRGVLSRYEFVERSIDWDIHRLRYSVQNTDNVEMRAMSLDEYVVTTLRNIGFTSRGLLTVPWELVPYSFVVDWFVNVGDYLRQLTPLPEFKQLGACLVTRRTKQTVYSVLQDTNLQPASYVITRPITGTCSASSRTVHRTSLSEPGLVIKSDFRFDDAVRSADAFALLAQRASSLFGGRR